MNYTMHKELDLFYESVLILVDIFGDNINQRKSRIVERSGGNIDEQALAPILDDYIGISQEVQRQVDLSGSEAVFLFGHREHEPHALAYHLWHYQHLLEEGLDKDLSRSVSILADFADYVPNVESLRDEASLMRMIDTSIERIEDKYDLLRLYLGIDEYLERLQPYVEKASAVITAWIPRLQPGITAFVEEIEQGLASEGVGLFSSWAPVSLDAEDSYDFYPSLHPSALFYSSLSLGRSRMMLGIKVREILRLQEEQRFRGTRQMEFFKALADATKLGILLRLKGERLYGGQLAEAMNLSGPTISHHMNTLVQLQLVYLEKSGNRIFYTLNEKAIAAFLDEMRRLFFS